MIVDDYDIKKCYNALDWAVEREQHAVAAFLKAETKLVPSTEVSACAATSMPLQFE